MYACFMFIILNGLNDFAILRLAPKQEILHLAIPLKNPFFSPACKGKSYVSASLLCLSSTLSVSLPLSLFFHSNGHALFERCLAMRNTTARRCNLVTIMSTDGGFAGGNSDAQQCLQSFWPRVMDEIRNLTVKDFRVQELPLARIKKIMKLDEDVKMISAEAPVLFAKAAQIFITELTLRAWIHTEDNKRRTLQRNDIAMAITKFDQFDFLIDIVPRDELKPPKRQEEVRQAVTPAEPVQYYFTLAQQPAAVQVQGQQTGQQTTTSTTTIQPGQIIIAQPQQGQTTPVTMQVGEGQQVQIVQAQPQGQTQPAQSGTGPTMQVMQQIITNTGEIQQIPVQLNAGQLQYIRLAQPVSGTQVVQGQIQTLAANTQQIAQTDVQQGQQQFSQFTDGQQLYQIQQVTMPAGQDITQPMFIQSTNQTTDGQAPQVTGD
uniref:Nuclear transcription factor Y subunit gamma n=12 Tax=Serpentes TaxID=8570 RepID=A0A8C6YCH0_NAJNA